MPIHVVIIGGGASAALTCLALKNLIETSQLEVTVVDPHLEWGLGLAFGTQEPAHILNVPVSRMSALAYDSQHFLHWLLKHQPEALMKFGPNLPQSFVPRIWYADYLRCCLKSLSVQHVKGQVIALDKKNSQWLVQLAGGQELNADLLILASGHQLTQDFPFAETNERQAWIANPWQQNEIKKIPTSASVGIIGTGLTMVDVVLSLREQGHQGPIRALSRRGFLPGDHSPSKKSFHLNENLPTNLRAFIKHLRSETSAHISGGGCWQDVMHALRHRANDIWQNLSLKDKKQFLRHLRPYWEILRHRIPEDSKSLIQELQQNGQLQILRGRLQKIEPIQGVWRLQYRDRDEVCQEFSVSFLINAAGIHNDWRNPSVDLMKDLVNKEWVQPHTLGLGIEVTENLQVLNGLGTPQNTFFAVGPMTRGRFWESTAIPDLRDQAQIIAEKINELQKLRSPLTSKEGLATI